MCGTVYVIRSPNTSKVFIGVTINPLEEVFASFKKSQQELSEILSSDNAIILPLELAELSELKTKEQEWKKIFKSRLITSNIISHYPKFKKNQVLRPVTEEERASFESWFREKIIRSPDKFFYRPESFKKFLEESPKSTLKKRNFLKLLEEKCGKPENKNGKIIFSGFSF